MNKRKLSVLICLILAVAMISSACASPANTTPSEPTPPQSTEPSGTNAKGIPASDIKAGFLYVGPIGDEGYSYAHDQGRLALEQTLGVKTVYLENVPENADCEKAIRDLIDQGCNVIYATSFGHMEWIANVAKEFPDVYFGHATGYMFGDNLSCYMGRIEEPRYLSGIAAGMKTKSGKIGYVAAMPIAEVVRGINAFTLGVRSVNPDATVQVLWTNSWYDPSMEKSAAIELINGGCDVIAQHCDSTGPQIAAQENGVFAVGYNAPTYEAAPQAYLTAPLFHWGAYYIHDVQNIIDGTRTAENYWEGMKSGIVDIDEISQNCAEGTKEAVDKAKADIENGTLTVFAGPIKDQSGEVKIKEGESMTDEQQASCDWFVEGVIGSIPK
ncbi:Purine-binding protein [bioreactor metagenome]|uniref:Purine-binding protein n=1 Tax=bioreactor metagenome TaxID=1076179 RepID=A0A645DSH4_9ZZZZ